MKLGALQLAGLVGTPFVIAAGQILFKTASEDAKLDNLSRLLVNPYLWLALLLYGSATLGWIFVIKGIPISRAYLFMALSYVYLPVLSITLLGERFSVRLVLGTLLIGFGIFVGLSG